MQGETHACPLRAPLVGQRRIGLHERIVAADVDPDGDAVQRASLCDAKQVVSREVLRVVEGAGGRVGAALKWTPTVTPTYWWVCSGVLFLFAFATTLWVLLRAATATSLHPRSR
jgi:hypothetical protein